MKVGLTERNSVCVCVCVFVCVYVTDRFGTWGQKVAWTWGHLRVRTPDGAGKRRGGKGLHREPLAAPGTSVQSRSRLAGKVFCDGNFVL